MFLLLYYYIIAMFKIICVFVISDTKKKEMLNRKNCTNRNLKISYQVHAKKLRKKGTHTFLIFQLSKIIFTFYFVVTISAFHFFFVFRLVSIKAIISPGPAFSEKQTKKPKKMRKKNVYTIPARCIFQSVQCIQYYIKKSIDIGNAKVIG